MEIIEGILIPAAVSYFPKLCYTETINGERKFYFYEKTRIF